MKTWLFGAWVFVAFLGSLRAKDSWDVAVIEAALAGVVSPEEVVPLGDMFFRAKTLRAMGDRLSGRTVTPNSATDAGVLLWTGGNIYYAFNGNVTPEHREVFITAAADWETWANVHFIARVSQANYVMVNDGGASLGGGNSAVGMIGGAQQLNIGSNSWNHGTLCHETGHALGLQHEQQRTDRDTFVTILTGNIATGQAGNFTKLTNSVNRGGYDFYSVMHYERNALSTNTSPPPNPAINDPARDTIEPTALYTAFLNIIGRETDRTLSKLDRAGMALMYGVPTISPGTVVTNTSESGAGSLRTALEYAFDRVIDFPAATTTVTFNIPTSDLGFASGRWTMQPASQTYSPGDRTTIDATTQPGMASLPRVILSGVKIVAPNYSHGLVLRAASCTVRGFAINAFNQFGISISGPAATGNIVGGCFIGTDAAGTSAVANTFSGIDVSGGAHGNTIGGSAPADRNVISGNSSYGITIHDSATTGNVVCGNFIGLNSAGMTALPNFYAGIGVYGGAQGTLIGGTAAGAGNVIAGNSNEGVAITDTGTGGTILQGNVIGLNAAGTATPNMGPGVSIYSGATAATIGGTVASAGNVISGNASYGIYLADSGATGIAVQGNRIGTNAAGTAARPNAYAGIGIFSGASGNTIGGVAPGAGNLISGNSNQGIALGSVGTSGNVIAGNKIGTDFAGTAALPNSFSGISIFSGASSNSIGGVVPGAGNVISANLDRGVTISEAGTDGNFVQGNFIGLDATGTVALGNTGRGIDIYSGAQLTKIGGGVGARNVISGNGGEGISLSGTGTNLNTIQGNTIGVNATATAPIGNKAGVQLFGGPKNNAIGGEGLGLGNIVAGNTGRGVQLFDSGTSENSIRANSIYANNGGGIGLFSSANASQAAPTLTSATLGLTTTVAGNLTAAAGIYRVEFFANPPGTSQGAVFLGGMDVDTNGSGTASFSAPLAPSVPAGQLITATATSPAGNTSSFSTTRIVTTTDSDGDGIPDIYESAHHLNPGINDAAVDRDGDGTTNFQEFVAGTDPESSASAMRIGSVTTTVNDVAISFPSVLGKIYRLEMRDSLASGAWAPLVDQFAGTGGTLTITDPGAVALSMRFYRAVILP